MRTAYQEVQEFGSADALFEYLKAHPYAMIHTLAYSNHPKTIGNILVVFDLNGHMVTS